MIRIEAYSAAVETGIFTRSQAAANIEKTVSDIIADVRTNGDEALLRYTKKLDGADLKSPEVTAGEMDAALERADPKLAQILKRAAKNIEAFHRRQLREGFIIEGSDGIVLGQRILPLDKVGVYIPAERPAIPRRC
jgi:histidinol dehydrogenase